MTKLSLPAVASIESRAEGVEVPMPALPLPKTVNRVEPVVEATVRSLVELSAWEMVETDRMEYGVVVPRPR